MRKTFLFLFLIISLFSFIKKESIWALENASTLARCLTQKGFIMYGTKVCPSCDIQREYFGESFVHVRYVDCLNYPDVCQAKKINSYPTWIDKNGKVYKGAIPLETLEKLSFCTKTDEVIKTPPVKKQPLISLDKITASFFAGLISFLAPCLLPLLPAYLSVITGFTFADLYGLDFRKLRPRVLASTLFFIAGFSLVYTVLGATGSIVGQLLTDYLSILLRLSGFILIGLGLVQTGILKFHALQFDFAWKVQKKLTNLGYITALVTGIAAALSWIPCVGPLLAPILLLSTKSETVFQGGFLLFVYSLGLTLPFLAGALFFPVVVKTLQTRRKMFKATSFIAGLFLIAFGAVLIFGKYNFVLEEFNFFVNQFKIGN